MLVDMEPELLTAAEAQAAATGQPRDLVLHHWVVLGWWLSRARAPGPSG